MSVVIIFQLIGLGLSIDDHFRFGKPLFELYLNLVLPNHFFGCLWAFYFSCMGVAFSQQCIVTPPSHPPASTASVAKSPTSPSVANRRASSHGKTSLPASVAA
ncbi:hypothetical protein V2K32_16255, partial [Pseudomonas alliivorans]|nr:hypothetical protein [Pseudomonas alliivorans]